MSEEVHAYPKELAHFVQERWEIPCTVLDRPLLKANEKTDQEPLPDIRTLELIMSVCYQASLLREEERPLRFRLILRDPDAFPPEQGPPAGLHRLRFVDQLPFNERELRKLSPSVDFYGSLIGVMPDREKGLTIWGVIHSGQRWIQSLYGGGKVFQPLPGSLVIHVTSPGRITVCSGSMVIATLNAGEISCPSAGVFDSRWLRREFASARNEEFALHMKDRKRATRPWAFIDCEFLRMMKKQVIMRMIGRIRYARHGGTVICVPEGRTAEFLAENPYVRFKYRFIEEEPRRRFRTLLVNIANALAESSAANGNSDRTVGWTEYLASKNKALSWLDEAIFEWAHFVAGLALVDGAVVMTRRFELIGFGGEISGKIDRADTVAKAIDPEGVNVIHEGTDNVGTRHNSAYRLCSVLHDVLAMIVSHDGTVQIVKWNNGMVTIWDQILTSLMDA